VADFGGLQVALAEFDIANLAGELRHLHDEFAGCV